LNQYLQELFARDGKDPAAAAPGTATLPPPTPARPVEAPSARTNVLTPRAEGDDVYQKVKKQVHAAIVDRVNPEELNKLTDQQRRTELRGAVEAFIDAAPYALSPTQRHALTDELLDEILGFGPLEPLLRDPTIGDILINGTWGMYLERGGVL